MLAAHHTHCLFLAYSSPLQQESHWLVGAIELNTFRSSFIRGQQKADNWLLVAHLMLLLSVQLITAARITSGGWCHRTEHLPLFPLL